MAQKSRRDFIRASSLLVAGGAVPGLAIARSAHAYGSDVIRIGLVGCGRCGSDAAGRMLTTSGGPVQLVAMADVFGDRIQGAYRQLNSRHPGQLEVPRERRFTGLLGYRQLLEVDLDVVILATPPGFRPLHFEAAVAAGKHVFLEKPVAVDPMGVRRVLHAGASAQTRHLAVTVGLPHRHEQAYRETIAQLQEGLIGNPLSMRVYRNGGGARQRPRQKNQRELEYQLRNWSYFSWLSGDQIVDRHIRNLDVANWLMDGYPHSANAQGGRTATHTESVCGQTYTQFFCEFSYHGGAKVFSQCRHVANCWNNNSEHLQATHGRADISGGKIYDLEDQRIWQTKAPRGGAQRQQDDLIAALRQGRTPNELDYAAKSTMTAIMGRMAAYTGQVVTWQDAFCAESQLADVDSLASLDDTAPVLPDPSGRYPVPVPGQTRLA